MIKSDHSIFILSFDLKIEEKQAKVDKKTRKDGKDERTKYGKPNKTKFPIIEETKGLAPPPPSSFIFLVNVSSSL